MKRYSLLTDDMKTCIITGRKDNIHVHEVFYGANRQNSIKYGCCIPLTGEFHNLSNKGIHYNKELDLYYKKKMQKAFEEKYGHEMFMQIFKRNYL